MNRNTKKTIIVPMDHGVSNGPIPGLIDMGQTVNLVADGGANAVIGHVGLALHGHRQGGRDIGLILHLSASTMLAPDPNEKVLVNSVTNALKMGADGVSMHVNIGAESEAKMLADLGAVSVECMEWGMPLLAMMYPGGRTSLPQMISSRSSSPHGWQQNWAPILSRPCTPVTRRVSAR